MLIIETPESYTSERKYICDVVFGGFLGVPFKLVPSRRGNIRITLQGDTERRQLLLADVFFQTPSGDWLTRSALPSGPLSSVDLIGPPAALTGMRLPLLFAVEHPARGSPQTILSSADILGGIFFLLTRYEEAVAADLDEHQRFTSRSSVAARHGFLDRPLADEYVEVLWQGLANTWPALVRHEPQYRFLLSHDIDWPLCNLGVSLGGSMRAAAGDILKRHDAWLGLRRLLSWGHHRREHYDTDPFNTFDLIMDTSEKHGIRSAFYFIADRRHSLDGTYDIDAPWIRNLLVRIHRRGHEIGLHGSYTTFRDASQVYLEFEHLKAACASLGIERTTWGGRQHYLRWENPTTWQAYSEAGLSYDSTLTFADHVGFRCGTCREYPVFNLRSRKQLALRERPLIAMEGSLFSYQRLGVRAALEQIAALRNACRRVRGDFTLLWHNSSLASGAEKRAYRQAIELLAA